MGTDGRVPHARPVHPDLAHRGRETAIEHHLTAYHHRLVLIPEQRVEPGVERADAIGPVRRYVGDQELDGDARGVRRGLLEPRDDVGPFVATADGAAVIYQSRTFSRTRSSDAATVRW
jgi:hypothetical protein